MFATLLLGGVMMVTMGVIGIYVGYIFQEVKRRPVYVIRDVRRRDADQAAPPHEA